MKAFVSRMLSGIDSLAIEEVPAPGPLGPGQIRIALRAASINFRDTTVLAGAYGPAGPQGLIPCSDGAGEIIEVAPDVLRLRIGDRVALTFNPEWIGGPYRASLAGMGRGSSAVPGTMREQIVVHYSEAVVVPQHLSFEDMPRPKQCRLQRQSTALARQYAGSERIPNLISRGIVAPIDPRGMSRVCCPAYIGPVCYREV
jgi:NADPH:quinone reductase-like Zn-dependent oxidoreductase